MAEGNRDPAVAAPAENPNPSPSFDGEVEPRTVPEKKVVVVMGATGSGKSRLAIDLASHFAGVEVVNADSMQVYRSLDVLTNKVPFSERNGVPHHLLGTIDPSAEFTSKDFRDLAIPIIDDILSRDGLPVIVGGTNYYIQALVSPYLIDDVLDELQDCSMAAPVDLSDIDVAGGYEHLKKIDPVAANRIHPNDHRKINRYLSLYANSGSLPSNLFRGEAADNWGRPNNFRYNCCLVWLDAAIPVLDKYVDQRVDCMIGAGLLNEVGDIYNLNAVYTRGLRQAIGVREFDELFRKFLSNKEDKMDSGFLYSDILKCSDDKVKILLDEAIDKLKTNTRKLVRRQRRRLNRLREDFGWDLHCIDATEAFFCETGDLWQRKVVEPCVALVKSFLLQSSSSSTSGKALGDVLSKGLVSRDLWAQYVCEGKDFVVESSGDVYHDMTIYVPEYLPKACGNRILRGAHEWEQHKQGRGHRKRILRLKKKQNSCFSDQQQHIRNMDSSYCA